MSRITHYLKEVRTELGKVNWPTRSQTIKYTLAVILISAGVAILFAALDYVFSLILNRFVL